MLKEELRDKQIEVTKKLLDGRIITEADLDGVPDYQKFITELVDKTGLGIMRYRLGDEIVYGMGGITNNPGLEEMMEPEEQEDFSPPLEWQQGYYLMWICPASVTGRAPKGLMGNTTLCGEFHKVDLGDEKLDHAISVRCRKCGRTYTLNPR